MTHEIQAEFSVIGALIIDNDAIDRINDLEPAHFYNSDNRAIFTEIRKQITAGKRVDVITIFEQLKDQVSDCLVLLNNIANSVGSSANISRYAEIITDKAIKRSLVALGREIEDVVATGQKSGVCVDLVASKIDALGQRKTAQEPQRLNDMLGNYVQTVEDRMSGKIKPIATGFTDLDVKLGGGMDRGTLTIVAGRPAMGKCLGKGTGVVMYDGTIRKVENIVVGDVLMGDDSKPRNVLSIGRGREQMYWVRQGKGIDYRVNESHILSLKYSRNESGRRNGDVLNIEVKDYVIRSNKFKNNCKGYKVNIEFPLVDLPVDPYFLGLWLGDGDANGARITNIDKEISDWLTTYAETIGMKANSKNYGSSATCIAVNKGTSGGHEHYKLPCLRHSLRDLGVLGNKHIPHIYIANSTENRMQLLAGLIDSDGHASNGTGYEITQTRKDLAEQIKFLCDSLGFKTSITEKVTSIKSRNFIGSAYRVRIHGDVHRIPVKIERKKILPSTRVTNWRVTGITVEADCVDDFYGFEIDGNHLFLLEDMTVTHNTAMGLGIARNVSYWGSALFLSMEMAKEQVIDRNISALGKLPLSWLRMPRDESPSDKQHWNSLTAAFAAAESLNLFIDDQTSLNVLAIRNKARQIKRKHGLDILVIDQLSFIVGSNSSDPQWMVIGEHTRGLIQLAKELNIAVVLLCQGNREAEKRPNKRLGMADLAGSSSIEQDAATIMFLYRDEVYNPDSPDKGVCEVGIAKQRQGATGMTGLAYIGEQTRFADLQHGWSSSEPKSYAKRGSLADHL